MSKSMHDTMDTRYGSTTQQPLRDTQNDLLAEFSKVTLEPSNLQISNAPKNLVIIKQGAECDLPPVRFSIRHNDEVHIIEEDDIETAKTDQKATKPILTSDMVERLLYDGYNVPEPFLLGNGTIEDLFYHCLGNMPAYGNLLGALSEYF